MNDKLKAALLGDETDLDAALYRFNGNEGLYVSCLRSFLGEQSVTDLGQAVKNEEWTAAVSAAHALKGVAGNMGFMPIYRKTCEIIQHIQSGETDDVPELYRELKNSCARIIYIIKTNL